MNYTFGLMCHSYTSKMHFPFINHATFLLFQAALGGPLVGNDERFHGMIVDLCHEGFENRKCAKFLSLKSLYERLELFQILKYVFGSSSICELYLPHLIVFVTLFLVLRWSLVGFSLYNLWAGNKLVLFTDLVQTCIISALSYC